MPRRGTSSYPSRGIIRKNAAGWGPAASEKSWLYATDYTRSSLGIGLWRTSSRSTTDTRRAAKPGPWFGVPLPPKLGRRAGGDRRRPRRASGDRAAAAKRLTASSTGKTIRADLDTIVGFSKESRATQGDRQRPAVGTRHRVSRRARKTINWAADQFRKAGIKDVKMQPMTQEPNARFWLPLSWEVKLLGDPVVRSRHEPTSCSNRRCRVGVRHSRRHADGAARLRRIGESRGHSRTST